MGLTDGMFCAKCLSQYQELFSKSCQRRDCSELGNIRNWVEHCIFNVILRSANQVFFLNEICQDVYFQVYKSRKGNPQKLAQFTSRSHPRHLVGKKTAQKDITIDITSDSQVNSNFPNRWSPASLTFNNYFYLFLYLYIT